MLYGHATQIYTKKKEKKNHNKDRKKMEDNSGDIYHLHPFKNGSLSTAYYKLRIKSSYYSPLKGISTLFLKTGSSIPITYGKLRIQHSVSLT